MDATPITLGYIEQILNGSPGDDFNGFIGSSNDDFNGLLTGDPGILYDGCLGGCDCDGFACEFHGALAGRNYSSSKGIILFFIYFCILHSHKYYIIYRYRSTCNIDKQKEYDKIVTKYKFKCICIASI